MEILSKQLLQWESMGHKVVQPCADLSTAPTWTGSEGGAGPHVLPG